jgi:replication initiator protein
MLGPPPYAEEIVMAGRQPSCTRDQNEPVSLSVVKRRLLEAAEDILVSEPDELTFQHSCMAQCSLPASRPAPEVFVWDKRQGRTRLRVEAGSVIDPTTGLYTRPGLPYGPKARLLLMHLNSEAIRSASPVIPVEDSMTAFFRRLMGKTQDGRQAKMLKQQLTALAAANFRLSIVYDEDRAAQMNSQIVAAFDLWFPTEPGQRILWPSTLRISLDYFDSLTKYAVPLDECAIVALSHSAVALDIYCWLAQRLHRIPPAKPQFVPWSGLHEQFGQEYARVRKFRATFLVLLRQVQVAYPEAKLEADSRGLVLHHSAPPVRKRLAIISGCAIGGASAAPAPDQAVE